MKVVDLNNTCILYYIPFFLYDELVLRDILV